MSIMLFTLNRFLEKWVPVITPIGVVAGLIFSSFLESYVYLIPWLFALMTFSGSLGSNFHDLRNALLHPKAILVSLFLIHVFLPLIALFTGHLFFPGDTHTITGLVLSFVIPTGIMSALWVTIYKGNLPLSLSIILVSTFLSPILIPYSMKLLVGSEVAFDTWGMMQGLILMIVLPSLAGMLLNQLTAGKVKYTISPKLAPFTKIGLGVVVAINCAAVRPYLNDISWQLVGIISTIILLASIGYIIGWIVSHYIFKWQEADTVALTFNCGMRNISAGAVIAITFFPAPVAIPVISGMLVQQLLASLYGFLLKRFFESKKYISTGVKRTSRERLL